MKKNVNKIVIILLCLILIITFVFFIYNKYFKVEKKEIKNVQKNLIYSDINITSDEVNNLYHKIPDYIVLKNNEDFESGYSAYLNNVANYKNTNLGILYKAISNLKGSNTIDANCEELIESGAWELVNGPTECVDSSKYKKLDINKSTIKEEVKELIGEDAEIKFKYQSFYDYWFVCSYNNDEYSCYLKDGANGGFGSFRQITKAQSNGNTIKIYDKYVFYDITIDNNINYYTSFEKTKKIITLPYEEGNINSIADFENKVGENSSAKYIHTFKKNNDGKYYWVSSNMDKN